MPGVHLCTLRLPQLAIGLTLKVTAVLATAKNSQYHEFFHSLMAVHLYLTRLLHVYVIHCISALRVMYMNSLYGLLPRESLRKVIDADLSKQAISILWFHALTSKGGHSLKSIPYDEIFGELSIKHRNFWYCMDALKSAQLLYHDRSRKGFKAFSIDLHKCLHIAEEMKLAEYSEPPNPLGKLAYGTLPRSVYETAISEKFRKSTMRLFWYLSLNSHNGQHGYITFDQVMNAIKISHTDLWRSVVQLRDSGVYNLKGIKGEFTGEIPAIPQARAEAGKRRQEKDKIKAFLDREDKMCQVKLNRRLTREERRTLRDFALDRIAEGTDLKTLDSVM